LLLARKRSFSEIKGNRKGDILLRGMGKADRKIVDEKKHNKGRESIVCATLMWEVDSLHIRSG